jgi:hypothetical protein
MSFIPVVYSKFGKQLNDLLKKKYDYDNKFGTRNLVEDWTYESYVTLSEKNVYGGSLKVKYDNKNFGRVEATLETGGKAEVEVKAKKLMDGLTVTASCGNAGKDNVVKDAATGKVGAEYRVDHGAVSASIDRNPDVLGIEGAVVVGLEGFSLGGSGRYQMPQNNSTATKQEVSAYSLGAQYQPNDQITITGKTEDFNNRLVGSYLHKLANRTFGLKTVVGGKLEYDLKSKDNSTLLTIGCEHELDATTRFKGMMNSTGLLSAILEHRLSNPSMKIALASQWESSKRQTKPDRFGVGITFGDTEEASEE